MAEAAIKVPTMITIREAANRTGVSYDKDPVYDLREWNEDHTKMSKGITLTKDELMILKEAEL